MDKKTKEEHPFYAVLAKKIPVFNGEDTLGLLGYNIPHVPESQAERISELISARNKTLDKLVVETVKQVAQAFQLAHIRKNIHGRRSKKRLFARLRNRH